jgi:hypothetical protein
MTVPNDTRNLQNRSTIKLPHIVDKSTNVRSSIDWIHREVHEGNHWFNCNSATLADVDDTWYVSFKTPGAEGGIELVPVRFELAIAVQSTHQTIVKFWEDVSNADTAEAIYNNRRETANTTELYVRSGDEVTTAGGVVLASATIGNAVFGGDVKFWNNRARLMLGYNTYYALEITGKVAGVIASWQIDIVERYQKA